MNETPVMRHNAVTYVRISEALIYSFPDAGGRNKVLIIPEEAKPSRTGEDNGGATPTSVREAIGLAAEIAQSLVKHSTP